MDEPIEPKEVNHEKINCYEIGRKFGRCGTQVLFNIPFTDEDDVVIPKECTFLPETKRGIMDGVKEIFDMASDVQKRMVATELKSITTTLKE